MSFVRIRSTRPEGRYRAGRYWPAEGVVTDAEALGEEACAAIAADPYLRVEPAEEEPEALAGTMKDAVVAAIAALPPEAFGSDGKPKLDALRAAVPHHKITAALRDEVWGEIKVSSDT